jgi:hypothetical protein
MENEEIKDTIIKEEFKDCNKCVHISIGTAGIEIILTSSNDEDTLEYIILESERLIDKYYKRRH